MGKIVWLRIRIGSSRHYFSSESDVLHWKTLAPAICKFLLVRWIINIFWTGIFFHAYALLQLRSEISVRNVSLITATRCLTDVNIKSADLSLNLLVPYVLICVFCRKNHLLLSISVNSMFDIDSIVSNVLQWVYFSFSSELSFILAYITSYVLGINQCTVFTHVSSYCFQRILVIATLSVHLSVCHTGGSVKNVQARITKFSPSAARKTLVSGNVKLFHKFKRGHPERGR